VPKGETSASFTEKLLEKAGILVVPGSGYGSAGEGYVRFAITADIARIEEAAGRMRDKGIPHLNSFGRGDQLVRVNVWIPTSLAPREKQALKELAESENFHPREGDRSANSEKSFFGRMKKAFS